ncbi:hypothetical protein [Lactobacillus corticis]|uniref:Uncharacterized protein n=1 Tax=Lactobacillus corticis TaxID=2201249 RepID=A0A916QGE6_9LACO|nr:hypothetical protein [Lactobacillus corticis]GFZ26514.1 hypothetical protein LCB40_03940 [Lactobacillus corticis]
MLPTKTKRHYYYWLIGIFLMGILASANALLTFDPQDKKDVLNVYLYPHMLSLYLQSFVLIISGKEIMNFTTVKPYISLRGGDNDIGARLWTAVILNAAALFLGIFIPYIVVGWSWFTLGSWQLGTALIVLHIVVMLVLSTLLLGIYYQAHPYLQILAAIMLNLVFHYMIENQLLVKYSIYFDQLWRDIHLYSH